MAGFVMAETPKGAIRLINYALGRISDTQIMDEDGNMYRENIHNQVVPCDQRWTERDYSYPRKWKEEDGFAESTSAHGKGE